MIEFNYQTSEIIYEVKQYTSFYDITVEYGDVLCLDFSDEKKRFRKVITTFFDGTTREDVLESKNSVYFSPQGAKKISVGRPTILKI